MGIIANLPVRPRNRSSRPLTIDPRQISINSIDLTDFILVLILCICVVF